MKKLLLAVLMLMGLSAAPRAETETPQAVTPVSSENVKETPNPAYVGETVEAPAPDAVTKGSDIFVTLTRTARSSKDLPANTQTTTPEAFHMYDAQSAGDAVRRLTSVSIDEQGRLGTFRLAGIRGATSNQTLILIDGRPMGGIGLSGSQDLSEIPVEQIDRIEVVRGGASALYGPNAIGGVINVITKRATNKGTPISNVSYEKRSYGNQTYRLNFGSRYGPVDFFFFGNQQTEGGYRDNSDARTHNIGGNVGLSMGKGGKLLFDIASYHANSGVSGQLFPDIPTNKWDNHVEKAASTPQGRQITDSRYARASYILPLPANILSTLRVFGSERQVEFKEPLFGVDSDRHEQSKGAEAQFELPLGFLVGGTFLRDRLDSRDRANSANNYIAWVENYGIFIQETFKWKALTLIPSGRFDHNSQVGDSKNPRVQTIVDANSWLRLSGSAGRSFRAPTIDDLFTPFTNYGFGFSYVGNPNLRPEKAWTYDAGAEVYDEKRSLKVSYFRANITDLIQTTSAAASTSVNVGEAVRQGMEIQAEELVSDRFKHALNYTYLSNRGKPSGYTDYVTLRLSPRHTVNYLTDLRLVKNLTMNNNFRFRDARFEGNGDTGTKLGAVFLWDLRFAYQIRQMELYIGTQNLTNKRYEDRSGYPLPGRSYFGGVSLRLWG